MKRRNTLWAVALFLLTSPLAAQYRQDERGNRQSGTYQGVTEIDLRTVSGDCLVEPAQGAGVSVEIVYSFDDRSYVPEMEQRGNRLVLKERFEGRNNSGNSIWRLMVPDDVRISFSTASGDFEISDLRAEVDVRTASGEIRLTNVEGDFEVSTASGDVEARGVNGQFQLSTASGNVRIEDGDGEFKASSASGNVYAENLSFRESSSFSSASGDANLRLAAAPEVDLKISSASGDATLELNGISLRGGLEVTARRDRNIRAPFAFDSEETIYRWDQEYVRKSINMSGNGPRIEVSTASGRAEVKP